MVKRCTDSISYTFTMQNYCGFMICAIPKNGDFCENGITLYRYHVMTRPLKMIFGGGNGQYGLNGGK